MHSVRLRGARTHNLKHINADLAPGTLIAITGVSGAGKSSLALDTLYAEGQRRFVESFSPYARQFLERLERPPTDSLDPIAAAVAVDRRAPIKSSRSTVATMADVESYISALFAREALPVCPGCKKTAVYSDAERAAERATSEHEGKQAIITYSVRVPGTEAYLELRDQLLSAGYRKLFAKNKVWDIDEIAPSDAISPQGTAEIVIDRIRIGPSEKRRLGAALEQAFSRAPQGIAGIIFPDGAKHTRIRMAQGFICPDCASTFDPPRPGLFSYQSPIGACPACRGFGRTIGIDYNKVIPDENKSIQSGAIRAWSGSSSADERKLLLKFCERKNIPTDAPWSSLSEEQKRAVLEGEGSWRGGRYPGVKAWFEWLEGRTYKMHVRVLLSRYRSYDPCARCQGKRLSPASLLYRVLGLDLGQWHALEIKEAKTLLEQLRTHTGQGELARTELLERLRYLDRVGLGYLTFDRQARTLSGGEAQRVALTSALGTSLTGAMFVLDEPTVGLHPSDIPPLAEAMRELSSRGNLVLVIEHEPSIIRQCDRVIELGPGAGNKGGNIVFDGPPSELIGRIDLATGRALSGTASLEDNTRASLSENDPAITIAGARENNLRDITVKIPLNRIVAITGPSGSGKSTLAEDILYRAIAKARGYQDIEAPGKYHRIEGTSGIQSVTLVDQTPLGRTSRGNPATYTEAWTIIRTLFAEEPKSRVLGFGPGHFSFNVGLGRCEACAGEGYETIEMQFLADVSMTCPVCQGRRFNEDVLSVKMDGLNVADVLSLSIEDTLRFFDYQPTIERRLRPLIQLGLGYLSLGQPLSTLSGGEAQRLKLARALTQSAASNLFILDEPSAGLHSDEVSLLNQAMENLVRAGASVIVVDHDLDVISHADWVIDLGPGAGREGGSVVAAGTPSSIAAQDTRTGLALRAYYAQKEQAPRLRLVPKKKPRTAGPIQSANKSNQNEKTFIHIQSAREHNLRDISVDVPHGAMTVITGPSGSGKSTLAFDVIFAEGQRRFLETLTPYARQFLPTLPKPDVGRVTGVPPSIALEQRTARSGANSTVATVTEIAHYLRLLYAKVGKPHCPSCDLPIEPRRPEEIYEMLADKEGEYLLTAPVVSARKGNHLDVFTQAAQKGIAFAIADGKKVSTDKPPKLDKRREHSIDLIILEGNLGELHYYDFERALSLGKGTLKIRPIQESKPDSAEELFSTQRACPRCGKGVPELDPRWFSFNTKQGRCETCEGTGIEGGSEGESTELQAGPPCPACKGSRLAPIPRGVRLHGERYHTVCERDIGEAIRWAKQLQFTGKDAIIAEAPCKELLRRLEFVGEVGLSYLSLNRPALTLSGGEMQRLRLAAQLGSGLTGALYVLDEPTVGLHPRDTKRLIGNLKKLLSTGSTVLMVEHDSDTIRAADFLVDLGPSGGNQGGRLIASGPPSAVLSHHESKTAMALADEHNIGGLRNRIEINTLSDGEWIEVQGAREHNLKIETLRLPTARMNVIAGVSGSGKSTLVRSVLYPAIRKQLGLETPEPGAHQSLQMPKNTKRISRALSVDQSPIGRTPRSVPATFLGIWDEIRKLFAKTPDAQVRGYSAARFSFNTGAGGRCSQCEGQGAISHEMSFLPDVTTTCESCEGRRFEPATLDVRYLGHSIGDILNLSAEDAAALFSAHPKIRAPLITMCDLGVGYLRIGQGSHTLSGGEAQRLKLAAELGTHARDKNTLYVLDEPTTGLHLSDVKRLIGVLDRLVQRGDTLIIIEHHPTVIAASDYVIELGPEGGAGGGRVIANGTPIDIAAKPTATGEVLRTLLHYKTK